MSPPTTSRPAARRASRPRWIFLLAFVIFAAVSSVIFWLYVQDVRQAFADQAIHREVAEGRRQAVAFSKEVREAMKRSGFDRYVNQTGPELIRFEGLVEEVLARNEAIAYVHWRNEEGDTMVFKGPRFLQKLSITKDSLRFTEGTTTSVKELVIPRDGAQEKIIDIAIPVSVRDRKLGHVSLGLSTGRIISARSRELADISRRGVRYLFMALVALFSSFFLLWSLLGRVEGLEGKLERKSRMAYVGTLASGLVHEIRNPLNGINLNLALLEEEIGELEGGDRARLERLLGRIKPNLGHLERISTEFLRFARPPALELEAHDPARIVERTVEFLALQARKQGVEIVIRLDESVGEILLDESKIRQILLNLMVNALQAMPDGGRLTVASERVRDDWVLTISDTGVGITPENQEKLFGLFFTTREDGVGLGLAIVERLVKDHDGTISVDSEPGQGTCFELHFPYRRAERSE